MAVTLSDMKDNYQAHGGIGWGYRKDLPSETMFRLGLKEEDKPGQDEEDEQDV